MSKKNYISPSLMPMKEIAQYLEVVEKFGKKTDSSADTLHVAEIDSKLIATAATDSNGHLIDGRGTVNNALNLGGTSASDYITKAGAGTLLSDTYVVSTSMGDEIKSLRDELYQMKSELAKAGMIKTVECYNGFIDPFKVNHERYIKDVITTTSTEASAVSVGIISVEDSSELTAGEYIVVNTDEPQIVKIQDVNSNGKVVLESNIKGPVNSNTEIYKTYGSYNDSSFVFGTHKGMSISSKEKYIILNDDAQPLILTQQHTPNSGYASQINIPSTAKGAIRRVGVQARVNGNPGGLKCYVIDPTSNITDITTLHTIEELKDNEKIIGESNLLYSSEATSAYNEMYFEFNTPVILDKSNYIFLFVQIAADTNNYWELKGLRGETSMDLQTNSKLYTFSEGPGFRTEDGDLYLIVVTSEVLLNQMEYSKQGLYSCDVKLTDLTQATRVRVELKVNREGRFKVIEHPNTLVPGISKLLNTLNEDNKSYPINLFNANDTIVIGNQIAKVGSSKATNTSFSLNKDTYAPAGADVYRIGYKVQVKANKVSIDTTTDTNKPIKTEATTLVDLPLIAVVPGKEAGKENTSSDRLIFEAEIKVDEQSKYKLEQFNNLEVQVYWSNELASKIDLDNYPELAGRILDIAVSTDNTYNTKNTKR